MYKTDKKFKINIVNIDYHDNNTFNTATKICEKFLILNIIPSINDIIIADFAFDETMQNYDNDKIFYIKNKKFYYTKVPHQYIANYILTLFIKKFKITNSIYSEADEIKRISKDFGNFPNTSLNLYDWESDNKITTYGKQKNNKKNN